MRTFRRLHRLLLPSIALSALAAAAPLAAAPSPAAPPPASPAPAGAAARANDDGDFEFLVANLLATDGMAPEALAAFERAAKARPGSAYIHLEHAQLLSRLAQAARLPSAQGSFLRQAVAEVDQARQIAPDNLDVLRGVGLINLELAGQDPSVLPTALAALETVYQSDPDDVQTALNLGRVYLDQQQSAKAADVFREVIHRAPQQRAAYAMLVEALLRDDKSREAETVLSQILDFEPAALEARLTLAELEGRRNDYPAVLATLGAAPEPGHADPRLQRQLAWAYYLTGDVDRALLTVEPLLQPSQRPGSAAAAAADPDADATQLLLLKGLALAAQGHNQEAGDLLEKLRGARPTDSALAAILSKVLERAGRPDQAAHVLADLDAGLAKAGKHEEERQARLELAQVYYDAKQWDRVGETLQPLVRLAPKDGGAVREPALLLAADALIQRKSYDEALKLLDQAQTSPPAASLTSKRAEVLFRAGRERDATRQLEELAAAPDPLAALAAAEAYQRLEKYADSIPVLEKLAGTGAKLQPPSGKAAHFLLAAAYERTGKREQAVAEFRQLLGVDPEYHAALNYLGYMYAERGENLEEARKLVEKAVALEPDNGAYVDSLGWVYYRLGRFDDALATLQRATRLETSDGTVQEHLGDVYGAMGKRDRAGEAYRRALELESGDPAKAQEVRRKLDSLGGGTGRP
jgi:tetratricopeptide (TPR) repeat protein